MRRLVTYIPLSSQRIAMTYTVYTLRLRNGCWYVGYTALPVAERIRQHIEGKGSEWTKLHPPNSPNGKAEEEWVYDTLNEALHHEMKQTAIYCLTKNRNGDGLDKVRGGAYVKVAPDERDKINQANFIAHVLGMDRQDVLTLFGLVERRVPVPLLAQNVCFGCREHGHFIKDCPNKNKSKNKRKRDSDDDDDDSDEDVDDDLSLFDDDDDDEQVDTRPGKRARTKAQPKARTRARARRASAGAAAAARVVCGTCDQPGHRTVRCPQTQTSGTAARTRAQRAREALATLYDSD